MKQRSLAWVGRINIGAWKVERLSMCGMLHLFHVLKLINALIIKQLVHAKVT